MIDVLIVDDHELARAGIKYALSGIKGIKVIAEANSGEEGVKLARDLKPDVIIMDIKMPGISGLDASKKILQNNSEIKIIILTGCVNSIYPIRLLEIGAFGYLSKESALSSIAQAVRSSYLGQRYISPEIAQRLVFEKMGGIGGTPFDILSNRELQITLFIAKGKKAVDISKKLSLSPKTVNSYRYRIFKKLQVKSDVDLTKLVLRHGLIDL